MKALIVNLVSTFVGTRSPAALSESGFETALVAHSGSAFLHSGRLARRSVLEFDRTATVGELAVGVARALEQWQPDLVVPQDATAYQVLAHIAGPAGSGMAGRDGPAERVVRSLGGNGQLAAARLHERLRESVAQLGLPAIPQLAAASVDQAVAFGERVGWPVVLKADRTQNGVGVVLCSGRDELNTTFEACRHAAGNTTLLVQKFIDGSVIRHSLCCLDGKVTGELTATQLHTRENHPYRAPTVVRLTRIPAVSRIAARLVAHWKLSGYSGFDFLVDPADDACYVIDHNPRINSLSHLGSLVGSDLSATLHAALSGKAPAAPAVDLPPARLATVFPYEWLRDPGSPYLRNSPSDAPWDDPPLLREIINRAAVR